MLPLPVYFVFGCYLLVLLENSVGPKNLSLLKHGEVVEEAFVVDLVFLIVPAFVYFLYVLLG